MNIHNLYSSVPITCTYTYSKLNIKDDTFFWNSSWKNVIQTILTKNSKKIDIIEKICKPY